MTWTKEQRAKYNVPYADRPLEQRIRANNALKAKMAAKAIAEGREPGLIGRPPRLTPEEKEASRKKQNRRRMLATKARIKAKRAAKALADGREPGLVGTRSKLSPEARKVARSEVEKRSRAKAGPEFLKRRAAEAKAKRDAIKAGTWVPRGRKRLTVEEKRLANVKNSQARRARLKAADGKWNISDLRVMRWRQNGICPICNRKLGEHGLSVDHWIPLSKGGSNGTENMRLTHGSCNFSKGGRHPDTMRQPYEIAA